MDEDDDFELCMPEIPEIEILKRTPIILDTNPYGVPISQVCEDRCIAYLWKITAHMVFKVGITSPNKGLDRLHSVINELGHDSEILRVIRLENEDDAKTVEDAILNVGTAVPVDLKTRRLSGRYEFREFHPDDLENVLVFMDKSHITR
jgi:hypothetical protein